MVESLQELARLSTLTRCQSKSQEQEWEMRDFIGASRFFSRARWAPIPSVEYPGGALRDTMESACRLSVKSNDWP
jgi:hypothetical protein